MRFFKDKEKAIHFGIIAVILVLYFHSYFDLTTMPARGDDPPEPDVHSTDLMAILGIYPMESRKIVHEYGQFPLWSPYRLGGTPIFSKPQAVFFYINLPLILFAPTAFAAIKWSIMLHFIIASVGMYILVDYLIQNKKGAFFGSLVYTFNGFITSTLNAGQTNVIYPYAWLPLIFLFTFYALEKKEWILNSMLVGIFFSLTVLGGGAQQFIYLSVLYVYFLIAYFVINFSKESAISSMVKIARLGIIAAPIFLGLISVFILPNSDLMELSVRSGGYSYEQSIGSPYKINYNFFKSLATPHFFKKPFSDWDSGGIGLVAFIFMIFSLKNIRKKKFLIILISFLILLLIFKGTYLFKIFWDLILQFRQAKGIYKGHYLIIFMATLIASYGYLAFLESIKKLKFHKAMHYAVIGFLVLNLTFFNNKLTMMTEPEFELSKNEVLQYIKNDPEIKRFRMHETLGIDWGTEHYSLLLGLHDVYGTENVWLTDYLPDFLSIANQNPSKGYGILNTKYVTSTRELSIDGYRLVKKFNECGFYQNGADICQPRKSDGPYLYINEGYLPRFFTPKNSILIVGNRQSVVPLANFLILNEIFDPSKTAIIMKIGSINELHQEVINSFDSIILTQDSIDSSSDYRLREFAKKGGILLPNVLEKKVTLSEQDLNNMLAGLGNLSFGNIEIEYYTPNEVKIKTAGISGFVVASEVFSLYPGWMAFDDNLQQKEIYRADGVISAVFLDGDEDYIIFKYSEPSLKIGALISGLTLLLILSYATYYFWKKKKSRENQGMQK